MTFNSYPWDGGPNMAESEWRELWRGQQDGFTSVGSLTLSNSNGNVTLSGARGRIQGATFIQTGSDTVTLTAVSSGQQRIDYVVLRYNPTANTVSLETVIGTPATTNAQEPALEPFRTGGGNLLSGLYEIPVARFTGGPGTAAQRGTSMRLRLSRSHFIESTSQSWASVNERHGDIRFMPDAIYWFDSNVGSTGQFRPIYERQPDAEYASSSADFAFTNTSPSPTARFGGTTPRVGTSFVAPPSGRVKVTVTARMGVTQNLTQALCAYEIRLGGTVGSGSVYSQGGANADRAVLTGESVTSGAENRIGASNVSVISGLSSGGTYNAQCMHYVAGTGSPTAQMQFRSILVEPL